METTGSPAAPPPQQRSLDGLYAWLRGLGIVRGTDRWVAGVCAALARKLGVDPLIVRVVAIALLVFTNVGILLPYLLCWLLLPDGRGQIRMEEALRRGDIGGIALLIVIGLTLVNSIDDRHSWIWVAIPATLGVWWVARGMRLRQSPREMVTEAGDTMRRAGSTIGSWSQPSPPAPPPSVSTAPSSVPQDSPWAGVPETAAPTIPSVAPLPAGSATTGMGPGRTHQPSVTEPPPTRAPQRPKAGFWVFLMAIGAGVATASLVHAVGIGADRSLAAGSLAGAGAMGVVLLGAALAGRRAPMTAFATIVALSLALTATWTNVDPRAVLSMGERSWNVSTGQSDPHLSLGMGQASLDLTTVSVDADRQPVSVSVGVGEVRIVVPDGLTVEVDATVGMGAVTSQPTAKGKGIDVSGGIGLRERVVVGDGTPDVVVRASTGMGQISIITARSVRTVTGGSS